MAELQNCLRITNNRRFQGYKELRKDGIRKINTLPIFFFLEEKKNGKKIVTTHLFHHLDSNMLCCTDSPNVSSPLCQRMMPNRK